MSGSRFRRSSIITLFVAMLVAVSTTQAIAQAIRPSGAAYLRPQIGISSYVGDNNKSLFKFEDSFPYSAGIELGYQFSVPVSLGAAYTLGNYPAINADGDNGVRHSLQLLLRYTFAGETTPVAPYLNLGGHATFGNVIEEADGNESTRTAFGPQFGLGLDFLLSDRASFFIEANTRLGFPDDAADGDEEGGSGSFDLLNSLGLGVKFSLGAGAVPVDVLSLDGPTRLESGQSGTYNAYLNEEATEPIETRWDWGDGTNSVGTSASHAYAQPGTYTVTFTASNRRATDTGSLTVTVVPPPVPAAIGDITANPQNPDTSTPVQFNSTVRGDQPVTYAWDFGDGASSTQPNPSHTYAEPGDYTVTLRVANPAGSDTRTVNVNVRRAQSALCADVTEMNSVYFGNNSSVLTSEGRSALQENLDILEECDELTARIEGYAGPGERNPEQLSEDRAQVVREFYIIGGIPGRRLDAVGRGRVMGQTSKKEGAERLRRVDTIPE